VDVALQAFLCQLVVMGNFYKGRYKQYPSGNTSVVFSLVPMCASRVVHEPVHGCEQLYTSFETGEIFPLGSRAKLKQAKPIRSSETGTASGYGGLGTKDRASWKSCRNVRERMAAVELGFKVRNCGLLTVSLPTVDPRAFEALARYSSYAMNRLNVELNRYFKDEKFGRVSVWEYQKRGALHCHILIAAESVHRIKNAEFADKFADVWYRILKSIEQKFECNMFLSSSGKDWDLSSLKKVVNSKNETVFVNFQKVRKSVVAYLSKYLADSNHEDKGQTKQSLRSKFFPIATWFQWNKTATKLYEEYYTETELCECEPDRRSDIQRLLRLLKSRLAKSLILADKTDYIDSKNQYNLGFYFIPANNIESNYVKGVMKDFAEICRKTLSQSLVKYRILPESETEKFEREYDLNWQYDFSPEDDELENFYGAKLRKINHGVELAWFGLFMLEFMEETADILSANPYHIYEQLEIDYG